MRLRRVYLESDLRMSFDGLKELMKGTPVADRTMVIFINRKMTSFKLLVDDQYLVYYRSTKRIPLDAIRHLPQNFGGTNMEMEGAIKKSLATTLKQEWIKE